MKIDSSRPETGSSDGLPAVIDKEQGFIRRGARTYFPVASVGPFPAIDEPAWLLTKAVCALAELTVIALWLIRRIASAGPPE